MRNERPILILTASAGSGHVVAARAMEAALRAQAPTEAIEVHDVLRITHAAFRAIYSGGYAGLVRCFPAGMGWLYDCMDQPAQGVSNAMRRMVQRPFVGSIVRLLLQRRPRLILNTHFLPAEIIAGLRRRGELSCPQVTVTTDFETHRMWVQSPTERYYTATELGRAYLLTWGVPADRVIATGIPVRAEFAQTLPRDEARRRRGLVPDRTTILFLASAVGLQAAQEYLVELMRVDGDAQIVAIAGRNEPLRHALERLAHSARRPVTVVGFTDQMHEWMCAADLAVTKPGGSTTSEALVCGLPMVIVNPIPGQETRNSDYLLEHGAALKVNHPRLLGHRVSALLRDPAHLERLHTAARTLGRPGAAAQIAADALGFLRQPGR